MSRVVVIIIIMIIIIIIIIIIISSHLVGAECHESILSDDLDGREDLITFISYITTKISNHFTVIKFLESPVYRIRSNYNKVLYSKQ